ncbi:RNA polymerase subunit sigma-70 [Rhodococcus sp. G-MC3]|uniref:RNA polymerase sigma factor n=1 Tax=Rhodococcus sp. G-MC3 TaxID=3046209 RepID=UPI0024BB2B77|nr:DUF6596 domain-containing protein [Rhodococcus sp. G-MC3]MDJ0393660.1 RNA polymerase subunit sigma-70 [Rhodococcus sp. G-MC3]
MDLTGSNALLEQSLRTSYGRLLALLAAVDGDIEGAEDALADAFERALATWPERGIPANPDGWLLTAARNRRRDVWKSAAHRTSVAFDPAVHEPVAPAPSHIDEIELPDKRLQLMLVCAHPSIDKSVRTPLMLDVVLGCTAKEIALAFALPTATLAARLGRAKSRIRDSGISFELPGRTTLPARIDAVLAAIYGAFAIDWHCTAPELRTSLTGESLHLAETLCTLLPDDAEAHGLAALICMSIARLPSRYSKGMLVPLQEQNFRLWDPDLLAQGEEHLRHAHHLVAEGTSPLGRFQLDAAIGAVHCARRHTGATDWQSLRGLHAAAQSIAPTVGGAVALAVVTAELDGPEAGLAMLAAIGRDRFQPAWAARAHLLQRLDRRDEAAAAYAKAISLSPDEPTRRLLLARATRLPMGS